ncbi:MAG: 5-methyltetrahydropteroyltriglutamate--homocysteine methyltransferase [Acidimicrobiales bacterium]|nr:5-methyltetrahydropteroyltriglutamate--homocysteine methyltransferase [Acidimicrobiales bacterium]
MTDWFHGETTMGPDATLAMNEMADNAERIDVVAQLDAATRAAVADQLECGVDIPTDGEMRRENYLHYHCRHLHGIDFTRLTDRLLRNGSWSGKVPTFVGPIYPRDHFLHRDHEIASAGVEAPIKITVPGPITLMDSTADAHYGDDRAWGEALAAAINDEVLHLTGGGCTQIQIDEPAFARYPDRALDFGFDLLERCLFGVPEGVTTTLHMCCGYPDRLDNEDYPKADPSAYLTLAPHVDTAPIDIVSIEDAHRPNDLDLFRRFERVSVAVGTVAIARSTVESPEAIAARLGEVADILGTERLVAAPDCGLGLLDRRTAMAKLRAIRAGADCLGS